MAVCESIAAVRIVEYGFQGWIALGKWIVLLIAMGVSLLVMGVLSLVVFLVLIVGVSLVLWMVLAQRVVLLRLLMMVGPVGFGSIAVESFSVVPVVSSVRIH